MRADWGLPPPCHAGSLLVAVCLTRRNTRLLGGCRPQVSLPFGSGQPCPARRDESRRLAPWARAACGCCAMFAGGEPGWSAGVVVETFACLAAELAAGDAVAEDGGGRPALLA